MRDRHLPILAALAAALALACALLQAELVAVSRELQRSRLRTDELERWRAEYFDRGESGELVIRHGLLVKTPELR